MSIFKKIGKNIIANIWKINHVKKDENIQYFFCPSGIGDTLYVLAYMKEYRKKNNDKKIAFIVKESHKFVVDMYREYVDITIVVSGIYFKALEYNLKQKMNNNNSQITYAHPLKLMYDPCKILGIKNISLLDLNKILLDLPVETKCDKPHINCDKQQEIKQKNNILSRKSILLCPYCVSIPMLRKEIWEDIAQKYLKLGYQVFTNVKDEKEEVIKGTIPLSIQLNELCAIIEDFEHIYAIRSGICDLIAFFNVQLTVLYPIDSENNESKCYKQYNFKNIGIRSDIQEIIVKTKNDIISILEK